MLNAFCALVVLAALAAIVWAVVTGQVLRQGLDGLFLVSVCLLLALVFAYIPAQALREGNLLELLKSRLKRPTVAKAEPAAAVAPNDPPEQS